MNPSDSPFDNAQPVPTHGLMPTDPSQDFGARVVGLFFRAAFMLVLFGFCIAAYAFLHHPRETRTAPVQAAAGPAVVPVAPSAAEKPAAPPGNIFQQITEALGGAASGASTGMSAQMQIDAAKDKARREAASRQNPLQPTASGQAVVTAPIAIAGAVNNIIDSPVADEKGHAIGHVYDILVDRQSGDTTNVIVNFENSYRGMALTAVHFTDVAGKGSDGALHVTTDAATLNASPRFTYSQVPTGSYISLRGLQGGQVLDDQSQTAGKIDGITYRNGSAENIVFTIPAPDAAHRPVAFYLPYKAVKIITMPTGQNYIQLNRTQMEAVARTLFPTAR